MTASTPTRLLTIDDLAERWGCDPRTAWDRVKEKQISFVWLGKGDYDPSKHGPKLVRFRLKSIEEWEARLEKAHAVPQPAATKTPTKAPGAMPTFWDGKVRGARKAKHTNQ